MISNTGDFKVHIESIIKKVRKVIGWLLRSFMNRTLSFLKKMWITIIRPLIDYGSQVWSPSEGPLMDRVEKLQYDYTKLCPEVRNMTYENRLKLFGISSLQRRFERYKIFYLWKFSHGLIPDCGVIIENSKQDRGGLKFLIKRTDKSKVGKLREQSFQISGPRIWNSLPCFIQNSGAESKDQFKKALDSYLRNLPDCPRMGSTTWSKNSLINLLGP